STLFPYTTLFRSLPAPEPHVHFPPVVVVADVNFCDPWRSFPAAPLQLGIVLRMLLEKFHHPVITLRARHLRPSLIALIGASIAAAIRRMCSAWSNTSMP